MRVLTICNLYPPHALGGYEMSCADVMDRFTAHGHDVRVMTTDTRLPGVTDAADGNVRRTFRWYWDDHRIVQPPLRQRWAIERHNRAELRKTLRDTTPDVVSVWAMGAMSLGLLDELSAANVPVVLVVCDEWPVYGPKLDAWRAALRRGVPTPKNATFLWLSNFVRDRVLDATGWRPAHETVTYSGVDTRDFPLEPTPTDRSRFSWRLLGVGRIEPRKGFATAIEALAELPSEATLRLAGPDDGSHAAELLGIAGRIGVADRLVLGPVPRAELRELYAGADAFLFTSAWQEPFGLTPVEAMACGTPVVAAATGGSAEYLVDGRNCLVVPPGDPAALAAALRRLAESAELRERLVAGGRVTAADLTIDTLADVMERWHLAAASRFRDGEPAGRAVPR